MSDRMQIGRKSWIFVLAIAGACIAWSAFVMQSLAHAEESPQDSESQTVEKSTTKKVAQKKAKGGKGTREKDADGSEAPDRFKADTVIKSQYKLNGQPLEVDTD